MPSNSLLDMFSPRDIGGNATDLGAMLGQRSNSLIGLGLGLMGGTAQDPYGRALAGYSHGASSDQERYQAAQRLAEQRAARAQSIAEHRADRAQAQSNFERTFARGDVTDAQRAMADVLGTNATPAQKADFMRSYYASKTEQPGSWILKDIIDPKDPEGERKITVQEHNRTGEIRGPQLPGQADAAAPANAFPAPDGGGGGGAPVYGYGGDFSTPSVGAAPAQPATQRPGITLPNGEVVTPPPGLNKDARKAWANHVATTAAKMQAGEMTEGQAKYSIYATGMEIAQRELQGLEGQGTSQAGKWLGQVPGGIGTYFQTNEYQNYRNAKDAWLNAKLRAESGATINPDEFARDDRIYFPQPGETAEQVAAKAKLREHITQKMTKAGGPGYTPPPPLATAPAPAAPTTAAPAGGATFNERFSGSGGGGGGTVRWGRDAKGNPVPLP